MASRSVVPLVAVTAVAATSCLAFLYLSHKKQNETDSSKKENTTQSQTKAVDTSLKNITKEDEATPSLTKAFTSDDSGSELSDAEKLESVVEEKKVAEMPSNQSMVGTKAKEEAVNELKSAVSKTESPKSEKVETLNETGSSTVQTSLDDSKSKQTEDVPKDSPLAAVVDSKTTKDESAPTETTPVATTKASTSKLANSNKTKESLPAKNEATATENNTTSAPSTTQPNTATSPAVTSAEKHDNSEKVAETATAKEDAAKEAANSLTQPEEEGSEETATSTEEAKKPATKEEALLAVLDKLDAETPVPSPEKTPREVEVTEGSDLWEFLQKEIANARRCCAGCGKEEGNAEANNAKTKFKPCAKCKSVMYCTRDCQKKHWKKHKKVCCK